MLNALRSSITVVVTLFAVSLNEVVSDDKEILRNIVTAMAERNDAIVGMNAEFKIRVNRYRTNDVVKSLFSGGNLTATWNIAKSGQCWFVSRTFNSPGEIRGGIVIPKEPCVVVVNGGENLDWLGSSIYASVAAFDSKSNIYAELQYFRLTGIDIFEAITTGNGFELELNPAAGGNPNNLDWRLLPRAILDANKSDPYRVISIDGAITKLGNSVDEIDFDNSKNYSILRRKVRHGPEQPVKSELECSEFKEVKPGIWLPFHIHEDLYANINEHKELWNSITAEADYRIEELEFDAVDKSLFSPRLPIGTRVIDEIRGVTYEVSDVDDPFSKNMTEARRILEKHPRKPPMRLPWMIALGVVCGLVIAIWYLKGR